jgi:DNA replication protein DnaC
MPTTTASLSTCATAAATEATNTGITPFDRAQDNAFFQVVNRRYENRSATIGITKRGLPAWAELVGGDAAAAADILDRLLDGAAVINIKRGSRGLREHRR